MDDLAVSCTQSAVAGVWLACFYRAMFSCHMVVSMFFVLMSTFAQLLFTIVAVSQNKQHEWCLVRKEDLVAAMR